MAISRMRKILIAGCELEREELIADLQRTSLLHPCPTPGIVPDLTGQSPPRAAPDKSDVADIIRRLAEAKTFLETYRTPPTLLEKLTSMPQKVTATRYEHTVRSYDLDGLLKRAEDLRDRIDSLESRRESLKADNALLEPWKDINICPRDIGNTAGAFIQLGSADATRLEHIDRFAQADCQVLMNRKAGSIVLLAFHSDSAATAREIREAVGFREIDLPDIDISPNEMYHANLHELSAMAEDIESAKTTAMSLLEEFEQVLILLEHFTDQVLRTRAGAHWLIMEHSFVICGWVCAEDRVQLEKTLLRFATVVYQEIDPEPGESPPVAIRNHPLFSPFQLITRLYGNPSYAGTDPSAIVSVFFALFFALALTDAGYGLILCLLALLALAKRKQDILYIMFWGGLCTIAAGLLTGGIFGDLFRVRDPFLAAPAVAGIRETIMWFDPMTEPMVFFRLVLALGVVHVMTGLTVGVFVNFRRGHIMEALVDQASWIVILLSLLTMFFTSPLCVQMSLVPTKMPPLPPVVFMPALVAFGAAGAVVVIFAGRDEQSPFFRLLIGVLRLSVLSGIFSYLGDVLSYIRLMALGMVTSGIAMAINAIAFMLYDIPVAGIVLTVLVLFFGHLFNMAINILGAFVHTLRLQYVEFFPKFFTGGGRAFTPLARSERYVTIID